MGSKRTETDKDQWKGGVIANIDHAPALNPQQEAFVAAFVANGGNASVAAKAAGYEGNIGTDLLNNHKVRQAIELKRDLDIKTNGATQAWQVMQGLLTDPTAPAQVRFQAARWTLEASGHGLSAIAAAIHMNKGGKKELHEMSITDLQDMVDRYREQLTSMKQVVNEANALENAIDLSPPDKDARP
jgi:phage terminase small subunit